MADRPGAVTNHLHLDMPRGVEELLDVQAADTEGPLGLGPAPLERIAQVLGPAYDAHATSAAAGGSLDHDCGAGTQVTQERRCLLRCGAGRGRPQDRHVLRLGQRPSPGLVAEGGEHLGRGADECPSGLLAQPRELGVLAEEAVSRMHQLAARATGHRDQLFCVEVARLAGELVCLIG